VPVGHPQGFADLERRAQAAMSRLIAELIGAAGLMAVA
jgi:hypothetical protein